MPRQKSVWLERIKFLYHYGAAPPEWWQAGYQIQVETAKGNKTAHVDLSWIRTSECPKSIALRSPQSDELVQIFVQADAVGKHPYGHAETWPGSFYDAWKILRDQKLRDETAQTRAINKV